MRNTFIALDSEKLGEHVDDTYYLDFGDNIFPHFKGNRKKKMTLTKTSKMTAKNYPI